MLDVCLKKKKKKKNQFYLELRNSVIKLNCSMGKMLLSYIRLMNAQN